MRKSYRFKASGLDSSFLEEIKDTFGDKEIEIVVSEFDETEYLFKSEVNKKRLLEAKENVEQRRNLTMFCPYP